MDTTSTPSVTERFFGFLKVLVERVSRMPSPGQPGALEIQGAAGAPVMVAVQYWLDRLRRHLRRLSAQAVTRLPPTSMQMQTQTPTETQPQAPAVAQTQPAPCRVPPSRTAEGRRIQSAARARAVALAGQEQVVLPTKFSWLADVIADAPSFRSRLVTVLRDPELAAMVAAEPRLRRVLRPLAHMLGVRRQADMIALNPLPRRVVAPRARPRPAAARRPEPQRGGGAIITDYWDVVAGLRAKPG